MDAEDFRSVNQYLGSVTPDELRILHEQMAEMQETPAFKSLRAILLLDREQHARMLSAKGQEHAEMAWESGYIRGAAVPFGIFAAIKAKHEQVQRKLHESTDGESR